VINTEVRRRVGARIAEKARQTVGSRAWLRIDDTGSLLRLTDRGNQALTALAHAAAAAAGSNAVASSTIT